MAVTQMTATGDKEKNFETCARLVSEAVGIGAKVCVFVCLSLSQVQSKTMKSKLNSYIIRENFFCKAHFKTLFSVD